MSKKVLTEYLNSYEILSKIESADEVKVQTRIKECYMFVYDLFLNRIVYRGEGCNFYPTQKELEVINQSMNKNIIEDIFVSIINVDEKFHADKLVVFTTEKFIIFDDFIEGTNIRICKKTTRCNKIQSNIISLSNINEKSFLKLEIETESEHKIGIEAHGYHCLYLIYIMKKQLDIMNVYNELEGMVKIWSSWVIKKWVRRE